MRGAHGVEIEALHQEDILHHAFLRYVFAGFFVVLMPVYPVEQHRCTIHEHSAAVDLHFPEAHFATPDLGDLPVRLPERKEQGIEVGEFRRPFFRVGYFRSEVGKGGIAGGRKGAVHDLGDTLRHRFFQHRRAGRVVELPFEGPARRIGVAEIPDDGLHIDAGIPATIIEGGLNEEVVELQGRGGAKVYVAVDAAEPPVVLVLKIAPVAPAKDLHGQNVGALFHKRSDIKFRRQRAVFAVADGCAVDPDVKSRTDPGKMQCDLHLIHISRKLEFTPVTAGRIIVGGNARRVHRHEGISDIGINGRAVALEFPVARHLYVAPVA